MDDDGFARVAVEYGLLSEDEVRRCRERLAEARAGDPAARIEQVARELGLLTPLQVVSVRQLLEDPEAAAAAAAPADMDTSGPPTTTGVWASPATPPPDPGSGPLPAPSPRAPRRRSASDPEPLPSELPGGYRPVAWIGRGPHGGVLVAEHPETRERRAVKTVAVRLDSVELPAFLAQCAQLETFAHSCVLRSFGCTRDGDRLHLFSRPVEGMSALRMAERVPLTLERACQIVSELCGALEAAHAAGIFHGNLKPENLLLSTTQEVLLGDFGLLWRLVEPPAGHAPDACPLRCLPPELLLGEPPGPPAEVYGLAAVLYELLTRASLFRGSCLEVRQQIQQTAPTPPAQLNPRIPPDLETILLTALARRPEERYASPRALAYDLNAFLHGSAITARRPRWWTNLRRWLGPR